MVFGKRGEHLAIELHAGFVQEGDEAAIAESFGAEGGIESQRPELAELALLHAAVAVGILAGFEFRGAGEFDFGFAAPHVALGLLEKIAAAFDMLGASFDAWHRLFAVGHEGFHGLYMGSRKRHVPALFSGDLSRIARVKVILSGLALEELPGLGDPDASRQGFVGFELWHRVRRSAESILSKLISVNLREPFKNDEMRSAGGEEAARRTEMYDELFSSRSTSRSRFSKVL